MPRLIDADALVEYMDSRVFDLREMYGDYDHYTDGFDDARQVVEDAPTVDAIEVVRCKDCKHSFEDDFDGSLWCCRDVEREVVAEHFCSYGERRSENV